MDILELEKLLNRVAEEMVSQENKWGEQNHPMQCQVLKHRDGGCTPNRMCENYEIPSEDRAKTICNYEANSGKLTWASILVEEVSEAISTDNADDAILELIQVAAVALSTVLSINRKGIDGGNVK